jgi:hypothetical protein
VFLFIPKQLERPHRELVAAGSLQPFKGRRNGRGNEFLVLTESFVKAVARKKTWVVVFVHSGKKGGKTKSVGLGGLHSFVVLHVARECPTAAALYLDLAHQVCSAHKVGLGQ